MVEIIRQLCDENNTSFKALERELGFGNGTIRRWDTSCPTMDKVIAVADRFGVSVAYIAGETDIKNKPSTISDEELLDTTIIQRLVQLTPDELEKVDAFVQGLLASR